VYAVEVKSCIVGAGSNRVYDNDSLKAAFDTQNTKVAGAAIDYRDAWVVVRLSRVPCRAEPLAAGGVRRSEPDLHRSRPSRPFGPSSPLGATGEEGHASASRDPITVPVGCAITVLIENLIAR
jgi:hypothetical protein